MINFPQFCDFQRKSTSVGVIFDGTMFGGILVQLGLVSDQNVFENLQNVYRNVWKYLNVVAPSLKNTGTPKVKIGKSWQISWQM